MNVVWFKRDLRTYDHEPLYSASKSKEPTIGVYFYEPELLCAEDYSEQHYFFIEECLDELDAKLKEKGSFLLRLAGSALECLDKLCAVYDIKTIYAHRESTQNWAYARDRKVQDYCNKNSIEFKQYAQNGILRGSELKRSNFNFRKHFESSIRNPPFETELLKGTERLLDNESAFLIKSFDAKKDKPFRCKGGRLPAYAQIRKFLEQEKFLSYPNSISSPNKAFEGCSRLSVYLALGVVSDREVFRQVSKFCEKVLKENPAKEEYISSCAQFYVERLYWRAAYLQRFEVYQGSEIEVDLPQFAGTREELFSKELFNKYMQGATGYPLIDAAIRALKEHGWINMRMRGMLASFALNELWLPFKEVGNFLAKEFLDYEPAIHWNQIQIHSGSSSMSEPLTYNTIKQAQDLDPEGEFVKKWVPELRKVPAQYIFEPWKMPISVQKSIETLIGQDYPVPIINASAAHDAARNRVSALRAGQTPPEQPYWKERKNMVISEKQQSLF